MEALNMIFYTAITLGVLIFIHELGHFLAAKLTGMRVDRFSIGFPPRAFGKKVGDTDYCVSWIPVGGYVKIAGMVDESMDTEFLQSEPQPWEFRARPMWARMLVISAGVIMNLLLAFGILWSLQVSRGRSTVETTEIGHIADSSVALQYGLRVGDVVKAVNGSAVETWDQIQRKIFVDTMGDDVELTLRRDSTTVTVMIPRSTLATSGEAAEDPLGILPANLVAVIDGVDRGMPAEALGLQAGDTILSVGGQIISNSQQVVAVVHANPSQSIDVTWKRGSDTLGGTATVAPEGRIGIRISSRYLGPTRIISYSVFEAMLAAGSEVGQVIYLHYAIVKSIIFGKTTIKESLGGPIRIAQFATQSAEYGLSSFLWFMAQLSISLAILNILPIPALDGGHLLMLVVEKIIRREIPHKIKLAIQQIGLVILLAFMAFVIYNDIANF